MALDKFRFWKKESIKTEPVEYKDEVSFEDAFLLAKALLDAVKARNKYTDGFGGFDDFADVHQHVGNRREVYDGLVSAYNDARKAFDDQVKNKLGFVKKLEEHGDTELAKSIRAMFNLR